MYSLCKRLYPKDEESYRKFRKLGQEGAADKLPKNIFILQILITNDSIEKVNWTKR